ncbi:hypothetical protein M0R72_05075 [Candidatus Pacearchaeota archaeon]|jgi:hypothetical protein|nr:hypothetical protein [Candidatus Pacearchaeota archaeon]
MNKSGLSLVLLSLVFVSSLMFVSAAVLDESPTSQIVINVTDFFNFGSTWKEIIIGIIITGIMVFALFDILSLTSLFSTPANLVISIGLSLIFLLTGMVNKITVFMTQILAGLGAFAIWFEIGISIVIFIGLSVGSGPIQRWAAKMHGNRLKVKAMESANRVNAGSRFLKDVERDL